MSHLSYLQRFELFQRKALYEYILLLFVHDPLTNIKETILQDFLVILNHEEMFPQY